MLLPTAFYQEWSSCHSTLSSCTHRRGDPGGSSTRVRTWSYMLMPDRHLYHTFVALCQSASLRSPSNNIGGTRKGSSCVTYITNLQHLHVNLKIILTRYLIMTSWQQPVPKSISISHVIAILCTIFRLVYRGWTRHLWWEDAWAAFALISDVICLLCIWIHTSTSCEYLTSRSNIYLTFMSVPGWTFSVAFTSVVWAARMSIIFSIIRIANSSGYKYQKWIIYLITVSFAGMWAAVLIDKNETCVFVCQNTKPVALLQMITDVVADISLIIAPLLFWKNTGLSRNHKILILSPFSASLLITVITIPHSIMLLRSASGKTLIMAHVKAALSLIICNLLVIVTAAYRVCRKGTLDPDQTFGSPVIFTSILVAETLANTIPMQDTTRELTTGAD
ncbi:uncharacterized protein EDB93DRAFT_1230764 [Suillus bovinus]|uniref:uncharacterized protein n=1 Tax=Suillus bovinus TaxID=48563 RepID=UPI001B863F14|nr:uncharacterized protein EDB93DRAFT_1230764 [Suillus bovinus]KAG2138595.1 hypothetical protein EDB93DRAFT_1230764 [Suillus bovinus]